jgi:hypothetical protein
MELKGEKDSTALESKKLEDVGGGIKAKIQAKGKNIFGSGSDEINGEVEAGADELVLGAMAYLGNKK